MFDVDSARLTHVGRVEPDPKWAIESHVHTVWEFIYFVRGTGLIDFPSTTIRAQQYHLVVYPPGLSHAEFSDPTDPEETIFLVVDAQGTAPVGAQLRLPDTRGDMGWLCTHLYSEVQAHGVTELAQAYTKVFLLLVERTWDSEAEVKHDVVDVALQYIHANYARYLTLDDLAHAALASRTHISHRFKEKLGISPMRYLQQVRLENAKRFLSTSDMPVGEIAAQTGFTDALYFSRIFKETTGHTPTDFRNRNHNAKL